MPELNSTWVSEVLAQASSRQFPAGFGRVTTGQKPQLWCLATFQTPLDLELYSLNV